MHNTFTRGNIFKELRVKQNFLHAGCNAINQN